MDLDKIDRILEVFFCLAGLGIVVNFIRVFTELLGG